MRGPMLLLASCALQGADIPPAMPAADAEPAPVAPPQPSPVHPIGFAGHADVGSGSEDLDGNGTIERWSSAYDGGSGFGGRNVTVRTGENELVFEGDGSFGNFLAVTLVPEGASRALADGVGGLLFGRAAERTLATMDGTFRWLWERDARVALSATTPFVWVRAFDPVWMDGEPTLPDSQYVLVDDPARWGVVQENWPGDTLPPGRALVAYHAHNHHALEEVEGCPEWRLFAADHGIVVRETGSPRHAWVYITTHVTKLRWRSIESVECHGGLVFIETAAMPAEGRTRIVVSPGTGRYGEVAPGPMAKDAELAAALVAAR